MTFKYGRTAYLNQQTLHSFGTKRMILKWTLKNMVGGYGLNVCGWG